MTYALAKKHEKEFNFFSVNKYITFLFFSNYSIQRYCPARWIRPKLSSIHRSSLKEAWWRLFRKIRPSPIEREPFSAISYSNCPLCTQWPNAQ